MKRLIVVPMAGILLLITAGTAQASIDYFGERTYVWAPHNNTSVMLAVTRDCGPDKCWDKAVFSFNNPWGPEVHATSVELDRMTLWRQRGNGGQVDQGHIRSQFASSPQGSQADPMFTTDGTNCDQSPILTDPIENGDVLHTEAVFRINWSNGTQTGTRDNNSYNWTVTGCN